MKFLSKTSNSQILQKNLQYKENRATNNKFINELLILEQKNFCAYTEKYFEGLDSSEVEHFDASKKYADDYYNYYAVIRKANLYKKDEQYIGASFFQTLFFHNAENFRQRIQYIKGGTYEETDSNDQEAKDLIDFLDLNHPNLYDQRAKHIKRLKKSFHDASYDQEKCLEYFREYPETLSFITAIEVELGLDLSEFYL